MSLNNKKNELIEFYKKYIYLEDLNSVKIDPSKSQLVSEPLFVNFGSLKENNLNNTYVELEEKQRNEILKKFPITGTDDNNKIFLFFPLIKVVEKNNKSSKEFLFPLFAIDITEHKKNLSDPNYNIPLELLSTSNYQPIYNTFSRFLGIDEDYFAENIAFSYLLNNIMKTKFSSAKNILEYFLKYLDNYLKEGEVFYKFGLITKLEINSLSKNLKYELDAIKNSDISTMPLINKYFFNENDYNKKDKEFIKDNRSIWKGSFGNYPLSKGQARVLQGLNKEDLISVIGAPGTGKTTLFLSVIASQIVDRALHLIKKQEDKKNFIFITSTSNKAVNNVIEEFKSLFSGRKDFYFIGGKKDNIEESKNRILNFIEELENKETNVYSFEKQENIKNEILQIEDKINEIQYIFIKKENLEKERKILSDKINNIKIVTEELKKIPDLEGEILILEKKVKDLAIKEKDIEEKKILYKEKKETIDYVYKNLTKSFNFKESFLIKKDLNNILTGPFLHEINKVANKIININMYYSLLEFYYKRKEKILNKFKEENELYISGMNIDVTLDNLFYLADMAEKLLFYYEKELKELNLDSLKTTELLEKEIDLIIKDRVFINKEKYKITDELKDLNRKRDESKISLDKIKEQKNLVKRLDLEIKEYENILKSYNSFTEYFRERFVLENKRLYELSNEYLEQEVLKQKRKVVYYLKIWIDLLDDKKSREEKKLIDFEEFYTTISLVYPVVTSTLASVANNLKTDIYNKRKIKPFSLCLSDESGMISIPNLLPALFRTTKAIVVGDPKQLEPIVTLSDSNKDELMNYIDNISDFEKFSPTESTAYHRAAFCSSGSYSDIGNGILLDEHRRCQPDIAELFKEIGGYKNLIIKTEELSIENKTILDELGYKSLVFKNIKGKQGKYDNTNINEIEAIKIILDNLENKGVDLKKEVGIITPFSNQETLLLENFKKRINHEFGNEKIGTVHKFQGAEFNYIIFSSVIFGQYNKASFLNLKPNLLNVAVSRAKNCLIHVGDEETLKQAGGYLGIMMKHYSMNGIKI